jgi:hypothetical protein
LPVISADMTESSDAYIVYCSWEGTPCRLLQHKDGSMTADIYRGGKGLVEIDAGDLLFGAKEISEATYKELVLGAIAREKRKGTAE